MSYAYDWNDAWRVSEWLAATLEMWCPARGCEFESRALRFLYDFGERNSAVDGNQQVTPGIDHAGSIAVAALG